MIDYCIASFHKEREQKAVTYYMAECLRMATENTAKSVGGSYIKARLQDILEPSDEPDQTAEEIIQRMREKLSNESV